MKTEKKKRIIVEISDDWFHERVWDELPMDLFIEATKNFFTEGVREEYRDVCGCKIVITVPEDKDFSLEEWIYETLQKILKVSNVEEIISIKLEEADAVGDNFKIHEWQAEKKNKIGVPSHKSTHECINALVGAGSFKAMTEELEAIAPLFAEHNIQEAFYYQSYLFAVGDGCGLTTYLKHFYQLIMNLGLFNFETDGVTEVYIEGNPEGIKQAQEVIGHFKKLICFDISEWIDKIKSQEFRRFLKKLESKQSEHIFAFRVPYVDAQVIKTVQDSLGNFHFVRSIPIPPLYAG